jgi:hypothetical protein
MCRLKIVSRQDIHHNTIIGFSWFAGKGKHALRLHRTAIVEQLDQVILFKHGVALEGQSVRTIAMSAQLSSILKSSLAKH